MNREQVVCADCLEHMRTMPENSVDAIVTDPPYGLAFMGVAWDTFGDGRKGCGRTNATFDQVGGNHHPTCSADQARTRKSENAKFQVAMTPIFEEALRVAKPGAHLLCFGGTRTFHRMACAIEDSGWDIRDSILWVWSYGQGFPKSMDVGKAIDKALGAKREKVPATGGLTNNRNLNDDNWSKIGQSNPMMDGPEPATAAAAAWDGWGTCLKPAWEPIIVARKPLDGTVAHNVLTWGVGALNIDACRVEYESESDREQAKPQGAATSKIGAFAGKSQNEADRTEFVPTQKHGRFPANLVHDGSQMVLDLFPQSKGQLADRKAQAKSSVNCYGDYGTDSEFKKRGDSGSAARFFYCAKTSKKERGEGNGHHTVKPIALMKWLVTLVTPEGGVVLDPFAGSGTTLLACRELGRSCIGIEREPEYVEIIKRRLGEE